MRSIRIALLAFSFAGPAAAARIAASLDPRIEVDAASTLAGGDREAPDGFVAPDLPWIPLARAALAPECPQAPAPRTFVAGDRAHALVTLTDPPGLAAEFPIESQLVDAAGGRESLDAWLAGLRRFAKECRFEDFFRVERMAVKPQVESFQKRLDKTDYLGAIEGYAGLGLDGRFRVSLSPFQAMGGAANFVGEREDGSVRVFSVIGPKKFPSAGLDFWSDRVSGTLWHESGHGILDGIADLYADEIDSHSAVLSGLGWNCYGSPRQCFKEHVVRAVMLRLIAIHEGQGAADAQYDFEGRENYRYLAPMLVQLKIYESDRARYPTLADFYPNLIGVFPPGPARPPRQQASPAKLKRLLKLAAVLKTRAESPELQSRAAALLAAFHWSVSSPRAGWADAQKRLQSGIEKFSSGKTQAALADFDAARKLDPTTAIEVQLSRGVALQTLKRPAEALAAYTAAVDIAGALHGMAGAQLADALSSRASLREETGDSVQARADLERALAEAPEGWERLDEVRASLARLPAR